MTDFLDSDSGPKGLGGTLVTNYPKVSGKWKNKSPLERLEDPEIHTRVKEYLVARIEYSEREMAKFKDRWRVNEKKYQAYITLPDWEQELKQLADAGAPPKVVSIVVPYCFATLNTIVTYLIHTFAGRKPMFQVGSNKEETAESAHNMELKLQYDSDHCRLIKHLFQFLFDGQMYGVGILRCTWNKEQRIRTIWKNRKVLGVELPQKEKVREMAVTYEGNEIAAIDPYSFYPDPRVPMSEVNRKGEFVFWKDNVGLHRLKSLQAEGKIKYVDKIPALSVDPYGTASLESNRAVRAGGEDSPGRANSSSSWDRVSSYVEIFQGSVEIIPAELGLGESQLPTKFIFSIANRGQIIQAEPLALDHGMHPVAVNEPYSMGYSFGQLGMSDYLGPMQDHMSWLVNSHMDNVRTALNNMFVFDPSRIEFQDLKTPGAGKLIRAKKAAYGQDIREAIHQFQVQDVTQNHIRDFQLFMKIGDSLSSITDNLRGMQDSGGRKTATEVRTSGEAAASRLAALARYISAQALTDLTEQMCMNNQQNLSDEFYIQVVGIDGMRNPIKIGPEMLTGDFHYPIHDGTLPLDRVAMLDVWKEIFIGVSQSPALSSRFNLVEIFKYVAELGGARNIEKFELQVGSPEAIAQQVQAGNAVPIGGEAGTSPTPGINETPADRAIQ